MHLLWSLSAFVSPWVVWQDFRVEWEPPLISWDALPRLCNVTIKTKQTCSTTSILFLLYPDQVIPMHMWFHRIFTTRQEGWQKFLWTYRIIKKKKLIWKYAMSPLELGRHYGKKNRLYCLGKIQVQPRTGVIKCNCSWQVLSPFLLSAHLGYLQTPLFLILDLYHRCGRRGTASHAGPGPGQWPRNGWICSCSGAERRQHIKS